MQTVKDRFSAYIPDEKELEEFGAWAFGPYYRELDQAINFMHCWNGIHGEKLTLFENGLIMEDSKKMVDLWKDSLVRLSLYGPA